MKEKKYSETLQNIELLIQGENDIISIMSTISCELFQAFDYFNWVGFYRMVDDRILKVGPYQGTHGCLTIDISKGVCGACVREAKAQVVNDVTKIDHHIACSAETEAEIVLPVINSDNQVTAVLDVDSLQKNCFDDIDEKFLSEICSKIYQRNSSQAPA